MSLRDRSVAEGSKGAKKRNRRGRVRAGTAVFAAGMAMFGFGCLERNLQSLNPCTRSSVGQRVQVTTVDKVDLLFMIDNSNSMSEEQSNIAMQLPRIVEILASGDLPGPGGEPDGTIDFQPVNSLHIGVVTSDMGSGANRGVPTCTMGGGDDGVLRNRGAGGAGCQASYPSGVFEFRGNSTVAERNQFVADVSCVAVLGTGGCGFEQQLESPLKALTPSIADLDMPYTAGGGLVRDALAAGFTPTTFLNTGAETPGHGGPTGLNRGFVRADSALAVVLITDEEDCSVRDTNIFVQNNPAFTGEPLNVRCSIHADDQAYVYPVDRYIEGFAGLRSNANLLVFAAITGIPTNYDPGNSGDATPFGSLDEFDQVLNDPAMSYMRNMTGDNLVPSCSSANGVAYPPRRIVGTARGLAAAGVSASLGSICADDFTPAVNGIVAKIADALRGACLPRPLNTRTDGTVSCRVLEVLPAPSGGDDPQCNTAEGRVEIGTEDAGDRVRRVCEVTQLTRSQADSGMSGWVYDNYSDDVRMACMRAYPLAQQRIAFAGTRPVTGSEVRLECLQAVGTGGASAADLACNGPGEQDPENSASNPCRIGQFCNPSNDLCGTGEGLSCDPVSRTCGVRCLADGAPDESVCENAGLLGYQCDGRSISEVTEDMVPAGLDGASTYGYCVNPTCN